MSEWSKEHAWKVCIPLKGIEGSNPSLSANNPVKTIKILKIKSLQDFVLVQNLHFMHQFATKKCVFLTYFLPILL